MADNPNTAVYEGGIPNQGFKGTFPNTVGAQDMFQPDPTSGEVDTTNGGPATFTGSSNLGSFVNDPSYDGPGDMEPGAMKTISLDDIKSTV